MFNLHYHSVLHLFVIYFSSIWKIFHCEPTDPLILLFLSSSLHQMGLQIHLFVIYFSSKWKIFHSEPNRPSDPFVSKFITTSNGIINIFCVWKMQNQMLRNCATKIKVKFLRYEQSSHCKNMRDSSVSYASAAAKVDTWCICDNVFISFKKK